MQWNVGLPLSISAIGMEATRAAEEGDGQTAPTGGVETPGLKVAAEKSSAVTFTFSLSKVVRKDRSLVVTDALR